MGQAVQIVAIILFISTASCGDNFHITNRLSSGPATPVPVPPAEPPAAEPPPVDLGKCTEDAIESAVISLGAGTAGDPFVICNVSQLQSVNSDLTAFYQLGTDIDAAATSGWTDGASGTGFIPIGGCGSDYADCSVGRQVFSGSFDGCGYTINGLFINRSRGAVGLFGATSPAAVITDFRMTNSNITGSADTGGVVARLYSSMSQVYFGGSVSGGEQTGGAAGFADSTSSVTALSANATVVCTARSCGGGIGDNRGIITSTSTSGTVTGTSAVGGVVGYGGNGSNVSTSSSTATIVGTGGGVGGVVGYNFYGDVSQSWSSSDVSTTFGTSSAGGIVGDNYYSNISDSFATGDVTGLGLVGGGVGYQSYGSIRRSFATGSVTGSSDTGAFIGQLRASPVIVDSFATGPVGPPGGTDVGGFIGDDMGVPVTNSVYDMAESTFYDPAHPVYNGATPWDFTNIWVTPGGSQLPALR